MLDNYISRRRLQQTTFQMQSIFSWRFKGSVFDSLSVLLEPSHAKTNEETCARRGDSNQPGHSHGLDRVLTVRI